MPIIYLSIVHARVYVCLVKDPNLGLFIIRETTDTCGRCCRVFTAATVAQHACG